MSSTLDPAGMIPPEGSIKSPQLAMVAFSWLVMDAVVAFCTKPRQVLFGQSASKSPIAIGSGPTRKRTISFWPSELPAHNAAGLHASTKMLSISRHLVGIWACAWPTIRTTVSADSARIRTRDIMLISSWDVKWAAKVARSGVRNVNGSLSTGCCRSITALSLLGFLPIRIHLG